MQDQRAHVYFAPQNRGKMNISTLLHIRMRLHKYAVYRWRTPGAIYIYVYLYIRIYVHVYISNMSQLMNSEPRIIPGTSKLQHWCCYPGLTASHSGTSLLALSKKNSGKVTLKWRASWVYTRHFDPYPRPSDFCYPRLKVGIWGNQNGWGDGTFTNKDLAQWAKNWCFTVFNQPARSGENVTPWLWENRCKLFPSGDG